MFKTVFKKSLISLQYSILERVNTDLNNLQHRKLQFVVKILQFPDSYSIMRSYEIIQ